MAFASHDFVAVKLDRGWLGAVGVPDYVPPTCPDGPIPKQMHLDLSVEDLEEGEARALGLGAPKADPQPAPQRWRVLLDPAGHPFCLSTQIPGRRPTRVGVTLGEPSSAAPRG